MKLLLSWLNDFTDISRITPKEYADAMTMSGSKVERVEELGADIQNVVVGKIIKKEKHKNADTLWVCQVDVGERIIQVLTAAQNINEGDLVPIAKNGAALPGGKTIKSGKLRGELSEGMMCSHEELGCEQGDIEGACEDGIIILQKDYPLGCDIKEALGLSGSVAEFEITSNRPDCLSVIGLARETAATFALPFTLKTPVVKGGGGNTSDFIKVTVSDSELCPRYVARAVKNIKIAPSPRWLRDRLSAVGVRPINNIVDITNYVMLEYGQPMHSFDRRFITGGEIIVRRAEEGEKITTLDGQVRELSPQMLVIADKKRAVAVAGVMGGENSEIQEDTKDIIFESALFDGTSVRLTSKALGLRTESSSRFEKGQDAENCKTAIDRACELVELLGAGEVADGCVDIYPNKKVKRTLPLEPDKINAFLGADISTQFMADALEALGFEVSSDKSAAAVPTYRDDVESFADIAEEVARIYGYNKIKSTLLRGEATLGARTPRQAMKEKISALLCNLGYFEIMTYSFTHPASLQKLRRGGETEGCIKIINPLGEENSIMRNNLIHSTLEVLAANYKQRNENVKVFEIGKAYRPHALPLEKLPDEAELLCAGLYGNSDFFDLKGAIEEVFSALGISEYEFRADSSRDTFHPGKTAEIFINGKAAGVLGEAHPDVSQSYEIDGAVYLAEIELEKILNAVPAKKSYAAPARYPSVSRDIAILVDDNVPAAQILKVIERYAGKSLESIRLFDVYKGKQVPDGKKSMAYSATFRAADRTLNEGDITKIMDKLLKMLEKDLGAQLR